MKKIVIVAVLAGLAWFGWRFAKEKGLLDQGAALQQDLEQAKDRDFNKADKK